MKNIIKTLFNHTLAFLVILTISSLVVFYFTPLILKTTFFFPVIVISLVVGAVISTSVLYVKFKLFGNKINNNKSLDRKRGIGLKGMNDK